MWTYSQPDELYHFGTKGMKWGVRRYQNKDGSLTNAGKKRYNSDKWFDESVKAGKDKPNISPAEKLGKNTKSAVDDVTKIVNAGRRLSNKNMDLSNMSDAELKERINRMDLERRYSNLVEETSVGRQTVNDILDIAGGVAGVAGTVVGTIALIKKVKGG